MAAGGVGAVAGRGRRLYTRRGGTARGAGDGEGAVRGAGDGAARGAGGGDETEAARGADEGAEASRGAECRSGTRSCGPRASAAGAGATPGEAW